MMKAEMPQGLWMAAPWPLKVFAALVVLDLAGWVFVGVMIVAGVPAP